MVGGPLLGLFSLGMMLPAANTTGAISGFATSLVFLFWMSFGQPRPKVLALPLSTDLCPLNAEAGFLTSAVNSTTSQHEDNVEDQVLWVHKISYAWYTFIGWVVAMAIGATVSAAQNLFVKPDELDPDLLIDPIRARLLKARAQNVEEEELQTLEKPIVET